MRRVVITGLGIVSSLGNDAATVASHLREGKSGIKFQPAYAERGFRTNVEGAIDVDLDQIDRKHRRFMGDAAAYAYLSMQQAIADSGLTPEQLSNPRTGLIAGSGGASNQNLIEANAIMAEKGVKRIGPYMVPRTMGSTVSACLATPFEIKGVNYSISSACATSAHCIGNAYELIQLGKQDVVFAGGGEELHWSQTMLFDAMGALSSKYNETPETASRGRTVRPPRRPGRRPRRDPCRRARRPPGGCSVFPPGPDRTVLPQRSCFAAPRHGRFRNGSRPGDVPLETGPVPGGRTAPRPNRRPRQGPVRPDTGGHTR